LKRNKRNNENLELLKKLESEKWILVSILN
jgi:hypothetical protein